VDSPVRLGQLAFGVAFATIAVAWLLPGTRIDAAWLAVISLLAVGAAIVVAAVVTIVRKAL